MSKTIYKYPYPHRAPGLAVDFTMPAGAQIRHCGMQGGVPMLWVECHPDLDAEVRTLTIVGTGRAVPEGPWIYIGTSQCSSEGFVWHWYERVGAAGGSGSDPGDTDTTPGPGTGSPLPPLEWDEEYTEGGWREIKCKRCGFVAECASSREIDTVKSHHECRVQA